MQQYFCFFKPTLKAFEFQASFMARLCVFYLTADFGQRRCQLGEKFRTKSNVMRFSILTLFLAIVVVVVRPRGDYLWRDASCVCLCVCRKNKKKSYCRFAADHVTYVKCISCCGAIAQRAQLSCSTRNPLSPPPPPEPPHCRI